MALSTKNIFLIDGVGALTTAILLSQVLTHFESFFGIPTKTLWILATIAFFFSLYSFICQYFFRRLFRILLKGIIILNLTYCLLTTVLILFSLENMTFVGISYFVGEIIIILFLVKEEYRIVKFKTGNNTV
jgi:hypothetical protein